MYKILILLTILIASNALHTQAQKGNVIPNRIIVKVDESQGYMRGQKPMLDVLQADEQVLSLDLVFPDKQYAARGTKASILQGIYRIELANDVMVNAYIEYLTNQPNVIYAEREYDFEMLYQPNDPAAQEGAQQSYLAAISAYDAWNIQKGDGSIVVGIIDSGMDYEHEDLFQNHYINEGDPINGIDDDGDGFIDNYYGWDFADDDHDPMADQSPHGTRVGGIAAAKTDNNIGVAGVGFDVRFMPIKIFRSSDGRSRNAYQAIVYAADRGCQVINLSWGSVGSYSRFGEDVINYAVLEKDAVVVAAAGNTDDDLNFYPASYQNVLSVAATDLQGKKASWATYGPFVDLTAPGISVYSTTNDNQYTSDSGSSLSAPMVAGAAALLRMQFPELRALQIMQRLRMTAIPTNDINDAIYRDLLGKGKLDIYRALATDELKSVRASQIKYQNALGQFAFSGDVLQISLEIKNILDPVNQAVVTLTSESPYVEISKSSFSISNFETNASTLIDDAFELKLAENTPVNHQLRLKINYELDGQTDYQYFEIRTNDEQIIVAETDLHFTLNSYGGLSAQVNSWKNQPNLRNSGLVIAQPNVLVRNAYYASTEFSYSTKNEFDYSSSLSPILNSPATFNFANELQVDNANLEVLPIQIDQQFMHWQEVPGVLIHDLWIKNTSSEDLNDLLVGALTDWALVDAQENKIQWIDSLSLSLISHQDSSFFGAVYILGESQKMFRALDKGAWNGNTADWQDSLSNQQLLDIIYNDSPKLTAGEMGDGNDVMGISGIIVDALAAKQSKQFALAYLYGANLDEIKKAKHLADSLYNDYRNNLPVTITQLVCDNENAFLESDNIMNIFADPEAQDTLYTGNRFELGIVEKDSIFYKSSQGEFGVFGKLEKVKIEPTVFDGDFVMDKTLLMIEEGSSARVQFEDQSANAVSWSWDFGNGYFAQQEQASSPYNQAGTYQVNLIVENDLGCKDSIQKELLVVYRNPRPEIGNQRVCEGSDLTLSAANSNLLAFYEDRGLNNLLFTGSQYEMKDIIESTTLYVVNQEGEYPSLATEVQVEVNPNNLVIDWEIDTSGLDNELMLSIYDKTNGVESRTWLVNGESFEEDSLITYSIDGLDQLDIKLSATTLEACAFSKEWIISFEQSPVPEFSPVFACDGEQVTITPIENGIYYYYSDEAAENLICKGFELQLDAVSYEDRYFAKRVDYLKASDVVQVPLHVSEEQVQILHDGDTINLALENGTRKYIAKRDGATRFSWQLNGSEQFVGDSIELFFFEPGTHTLQLESWDAIDCYAQTSLQIVVVDDLLLTIDDSVSELIAIYPNPSNQSWNLKYPNHLKIDKWVLYDMHGRMIQTSKETDFHHIDGTKLSPSVYLLEMQLIDRKVYRRLIKSE